MAQNFHYFAPDLTDGQLLEAFAALLSSPELDDALLHVNIVRLGKPLWNAGGKQWKALGKFPRIDNPEMADLQVVSLASVAVSKPPAKTTLALNRQGAPGEPSRLTVTVDDGQGSDDLTATCLVAATRAGLIAPRVSAEGPLVANASIQALSEQVASLRELVRTQARNNEAIRAQLEVEYQEKRRQLDADFHRRWASAEAELAERRGRLDDEIGIRERALAALELEKQNEFRTQAERLQEREQSLDLQGEREERRRLRREIQDAAKRMFEKPDLSEDAKTNFKRVATTCWWIAGVSTVFFAVAIFAPPIIELAGVELSNGLMALAWSVRAFAGLAVTVVLAYQVRWLSSWSKQVTALELRSKQFALDIDRASWLVEMNLEYEKEGKSLQEGLIESFSRGLFEGDTRSASREAPSTSLLRLFQNADSLKLGAAGAELSITGSGVQKADKQAKKAGES